MRNDILGGAATFVAMANIIVVNPAILNAAGLPIGASCCFSGLLGTSTSVHRVVSQFESRAISLRLQM